MKYLGRYIEDVLKLKPLGEVSCLDGVDDATGQSGVQILIDGVITGLFVATTDYVKWLEHIIDSHESPDSTTRPVCGWNMELNSSPAYFSTTTTTDPDIALHSIKL